MPKGFKKIWKFDKSTGEYYIPNLKSFLLKQEKDYPTMMDLYKHQMDLIKKDYPQVFAQYHVLSNTPTVTVIAGPNGAGKSSLQSLLRQAHLFDCSVVNIDALEIDIDTLPADPLRYAGEIAKRTDKKFRELCEEAISKKNDFAFECNLRAEQVKYLGLFEEAGYNINLVFIWLDSLELSIDRVKKRVLKGGHHVGNKSIKINYTEGLKNLDEYFTDWNNVYIINNSKDLSDKTSEEIRLPLIIYIEKGEIRYVTRNINIDILNRDFPNIMQSFIK